MVFRVQTGRLVVVTRVVWWIPWIVAARSVRATVVGFPSKCEWGESSITSFDDNITIFYFFNFKLFNVTFCNCRFDFVRLHVTMEAFEMQEREISVCICALRQWPVDCYIVTSLDPGIPIVSINEFQILEVVAHFISVYLQNIVGLVF